MESTVKFNVDSQLLLYSLGEDAVESDSIAIMELIKNGVDAGANNIVVDLTSIKEDRIKIIDDGNGMSRKEVEEYWFDIASSSKIDHPHLLGGKGVGRFSFFRFADKIHVETSQGQQTTEFIIDRKMLEEEKDLNKTEVPVKTYDSASSNGTIITLTSLKHEIDLHEIEINIQNLFLDKSKTQLEISYPDDYQATRFLQPEDIFSYVTMDATIVMRNNKVTDINVIGQYYKQKQILENTTNNLQMRIDEINKVANLGEMTFRITNFYFHPSNSDLSASDREYIKNHFLQVYQGINIYRNNVKIHGHGKNDWLKLAEGRVQNSSKYLDNKMTYGYIILDSVTEKKLIEKTNRENFKKNDYSIYLDALSKVIIKYLSELRALFAKEVIRKDSRKAAELENRIPQNIKLAESKGNEPIRKEDEEGKKNYSDKTTVSVSDKGDRKTADNDRVNENKLKNQGGEDKEKQLPQSKVGSYLSKAKPHLNNECIIDKSFIVHIKTPEKIKCIVEELKNVRKNNIYSQALLLRCLIDISTGYFQNQYQVEKVNNNLPNNILKSLNYINDKKMLDHKVVSRVRNHVNKEKMTDFFNGVAHEYDYRPTHTELLEVWDIMDPYISLCIQPRD